MNEVRSGSKICMVSELWGNMIETKKKNDYQSLSHFITANKTRRCRNGKRFAFSRERKGWFATFIYTHVIGKWRSMYAKSHMTSYFTLRDLHSWMDSSLSHALKNRPHWLSQQKACHLTICSVSIDTVSKEQQLTSDIAKIETSNLNIIYIYVEHNIEWQLVSVICTSWLRNVTRLKTN